MVNVQYGNLLGFSLAKFDIAIDVGDFLDFDKFFAFSFDRESSQLLFKPLTRPGCYVFCFPMPVRS